MSTNNRSTETAELPRFVPWEASMDKKHYLEKLRLEAGLRRREAERLEVIIKASLEEAERIEALANSLERDW